MKPTTLRSSDVRKFGVTVEWVILENLVRRRDLRLGIFFYGSRSGAKRLTVTCAEGFPLKPAKEWAEEFLRGLNEHAERRELFGDGTYVLIGIETDGNLRTVPFAYKAAERNAMKGWAHQVLSPALPDSPFESHYGWKRSVKRLRPVADEQYPPMPRGRDDRRTWWADGVQFRKDKGVLEDTA